MIETKKYVVIECNEQNIEILKEKGMKYTVIEIIEPNE